MSRLVSFELAVMEQFSVLCGTVQYSTSFEPETLNCRDVLCLQAGDLRVT
jgi:hypothetical protein